MIENTCSPSPKLRLLVQTKQGTLRSEKWSTDMAENRGGGSIFPPGDWLCVPFSILTQPIPARLHLLLDCTPGSRSDRARVKGQSK